MLVSPTNERDFVETYLGSKTVDEQKQLINNFASITNVHLMFDNTLCLHSIRFISRYLKLKSFEMTRYNSTQWTNIELGFFYDDIMDLVVSAKESGLVNVNMTRSALTRCFSHVENKIYRQTMPQGTKRCLSLHVDDFMTNRNSVNLLVKCDQQSSEHTIHLNLYSTILEDLEFLVNLAPITNVDEFKFAISATPRRQFERCASVAVLGRFENIFTGMPSLKKAHLDIPSSYTEETTNHYIYDQVYRGLVHPQLKELTISAASDMKIQTMLNRYAFTFPALECLTFYYYSGTWTPENGEFRVILSRYSLKTFTIDMTPVKRNTCKYLANQFFVIELEMLSSNNKRQSFKVSLDLSSITPFSDTDLQGLIRGKDYFRVYICIGSLERLDLCVDNNTSKEEFYSASCLTPVTCVM